MRGPAGDKSVVVRRKKNQKFRERDKRANKKKTFISPYTYEALGLTLGVINLARGGSSNGLRMTAANWVRELERVTQAQQG